MPHFVHDTPLVSACRRRPWRSWSALRPLIIAMLMLPGLRPDASAAPLLLQDSAALDRFAQLIMAYRDASRVRWVVASASAAEQRQVLDELASRLGPAGSDLLEKVSTTANLTASRAAPQNGAEEKSVPRAYITLGEAQGLPCSWRVTVVDPAAPSPGFSPLAIPLEQGDSLPTSRAATFEIGFSGPLQSTLYAFAETAPGTIRDLAAAPEITIPVNSENETLVLVRARRPVPFLDGIRMALANDPGAPGKLGLNAALSERFHNGGRGIGANIQLFDPARIVAAARIDPPKQEAPPSETEPDLFLETPIARNEDLVETCLYRITRLPG